MMLAFPAHKYAAQLAIEAIRSGRECIGQENLEALGTFPPLLSMEERSSALA